MQENTTFTLSFRPLIEVVFNSDRDGFITVVVDEFSEVSFSDSDSGSVTSTGEFIDNFAGFHFRDSTHTPECVVERLTVEDLAEDIELFGSSFEDNGDIFEVSPASDDIFESILVEPEALDLVVSAIRFEKVVVIDNATDRRAVGCMNSISDGNFRKRGAFRSGGAAGLRVIFL